MDDVRVVRLPAELVAQVDEAAAGELRSRSNMAKKLIVEGVERRAHDVAEEGSQDA
jgi:metal-responsive CopG/Arc/MetJ family transcriptional regulator